MVFELRAEREYEFSRLGVQAASTSGRRTYGGPERGRESGGQRRREKKMRWKEKEMEMGRR